MIRFKKTGQRGAPEREHYRWHSSAKSQSQPQPQSQPQSQTQRKSQETQFKNFSNEKSLRQKTSGGANGRDGATAISNATEDTQTSCRASSTHSQSSTRSSRYISATVRYELRMRYRGRCCYIDPLAGQRCESRHQLEVEHIQPVAQCGSNDITNLRLTCRNHNVYYAAQSGLSWHGPFRREYPLGRRV